MNTLDAIRARVGSPLRNITRVVTPVFVVLLAMSCPGLAATFNVNSTADGTDANPGNGVCETGAGNGICTLRAAIQESNASAAFPPDQIILPAGTYVLTGGFLEITASASIVGGGANSTFIDGSNASSIFLISNSGSNPIVNISGVTIRNGNGGFDFGTGIRVTPDSSLSLANSIVSGNTASVGGVGIANEGSLTVFRSTIRDNVIDGGGGGLTGTGAGIFNTSVANIIESTVSGNVGIRGGGISNSGNLDIRNSTISGNSASVGGGIRNISPGVVNIAFSTITDNEAGLETGEPLANRVGGGIFNLGQVNIGNSILARNTDARLTSDPLFAPDCSSTAAFGFTSFRGNLVGVVNANCDMRDTIFGAPPLFDMTGTEGTPLNPLIGALSNNGGPTATHGLLVGSPAIDQGTGVTSATFFDCPSRDQRGLSRPVDGDGNGVDDCDIGASEFGAIPPEIVNPLMSEPTLMTSFSAIPTANGPAGTFFITATFTNTSTTAIRRPFFEVTELSGGNVLINASSGPGGVGATLTPDVGADQQLTPAESMSAEFRIGLQNSVSVHFPGQRDGRTRRVGGRMDERRQRPGS